MTDKKILEGREWLTDSIHAAQILGFEHPVLQLYSKHSWRQIIYSVFTLTR